MEIGKPQRIIVVEPLRNPVPAKPGQKPERVPQEPQPVREPEKVPAGV